MKSLLSHRFSHSKKILPSSSSSSSSFLLHQQKTWNYKNRIFYTTHDVNPSTITFQSGNIGHLAASNALCSTKQTVVHAVVSKGDNKQSDGGSGGSGTVPLNVEYRLKSYAYGMIPNTRNRREGNTVEDMLAARVIDRSLRPLFPSSSMNEMQVTCTVHSLDPITNDPITTAVNAVSCALMQANVGWQGPIGCVRVGRINGVFKTDLSEIERLHSDLDLLYTGTKSRVLMMEVEATPIPEQELKEALRFAQAEATKVIQTQIEFLQSIKTSLEGSEVITESESESTHANSKIKDTNSEDSISISQEELNVIAEEIGMSAALSFFTTGEPLRTKRRVAEGAVNQQITRALENDPRVQNVPKSWIDVAVAQVMETAFRTAALAGHRPDRRAQTEVRQVTCQPEMLPNTVHGSAFFTRGDTHVLCAVTLGPKTSAMNLDSTSSQSTKQRGVDSDSNSITKHFFLHYDFPPYCTGKVGSASAVNRRMVGHGMLAEKALRSLIPSFEDFPYTVRVSSECTSSSGSSSMATVCGASLALMDAGVPIKAPAAGVSIGLVTKFNSDDDASSSSSDDVSEYRLLTDILGTEDHFGDMDFKVAGTETGVTAIQLDVKLPRGVPLDILCEALDSARDGRLQILNKMQASLPHRRVKLKVSAPTAQLVKFDPERIRFLLGPGGETVRYIEELYSCEIDTSTPGMAYLFGRDPRLVQQARDLVQDLVVPIKEGDVVQAEVIDVRDFGAFVRVTRAQEALLHGSELTHDTSLLKQPLFQILKVGQRLTVKITAVDTATGMVKVSRKCFLDKNAKDNLLAEAEDVTSESKEASAQASSFPVTPPRPWNAQFFRHSVANPK